MLYYVAMGTGLTMVIGSAYKMFKIMGQSVIINKREFRDIEQRIRADERYKVKEENEDKEIKKEGNILWLSGKN